MKRQRWGSIWTLAAVGLLVIAATAWACTPQPLLLAANPMALAPGEPVELTGSGVPAAAAVQIRLNDDTGPVLAEAVTDSAGNFRSSVNLPPDLAPGVYTLVLTAGEGSAGGRVALEVTGGSTAGGGEPREVSTDLWSGFENSGSLPQSEIVPGAQDSAEQGRTAGLGLVSAGALLLVASAGAWRIRSRRSA